MILNQTKRVHQNWSPKNDQKKTIFLSITKWPSVHVEVWIVVEVFSSPTNVGNTCTFWLALGSVSDRGRTNTISPIGFRQILTNSCGNPELFETSLYLQDAKMFRLKIGSGQLTNMWDAAAITFYPRCNFEYCLWRMPGMPRYTLSILKLVGNSGTGGFWDVPTISPMTFALILSCFLVYQQTWRHVSSLNAWAGNWLIPLYNCMSPCQSFRDFPDMVFTSHLKAWLIGILILVWFIDHNPGPV